MEKVRINIKGAAPMTREEAFREINKTQDDYINQLIQFMNDPTNQSMKTVNFTSPTGTGKTKTPQQRRPGAD